MDLFEKILATGYKYQRLDKSTGEFVEMKAFDALNKIKAVMEDDSLDDFECVEKIVCVFEELGVYCGGRHDFG